MKENEQQMLLSSSRSANILGRSLILTLHNSRMCMALTFPIKWSPNLTDKWAFGWFMEKYVNDRQIILSWLRTIVWLSWKHKRIIISKYISFMLSMFYSIVSYINRWPVYTERLIFFFFQNTFHFSDFCILVCYTFIQRNRILKTFIYVRL